MPTRKPRKNARKSVKKTVAKGLIDSVKKSRAIVEEEVDFVKLKDACGEAGLCIAFGIEEEKIKQFFRNFSFDLVTAVRRIGEPSFNGFVKELRFEKRGYEAFAVLKSSARRSADNMMYEFRVGQFLNKMAVMFPCFLQTYGLYKYVSRDSWKRVKGKTMQIETFRHMITPTPLDWREACETPELFCYLIQHIRGCKPASEFLGKKDYPYLFSTLYQVYYPLYHMRKNFTHYDLHYHNVVLYEPENGKYIQFHYETETGVVSFKSPYLVKIIDYGRSYFNDGTEDSKDIYEKVCKMKNCRPNCGEGHGFEFFKDLSRGKTYSISQKKNESHDLRFLTFVLDGIKKWLPSSPEWFRDYVKPYENIEYTGEDGVDTIEKSCPKKLCDLTAVYDRLNKTLPLSNVQFDPLYGKKFGDLHVKIGNPVHFVKAPSN